MTTSRAKIRIRRRGALLLILAGVAAVAPVTGRHGIMAFADDGGDGGSNSGSGGGDDGGGDDGGGDDGGGDDGGGDDGGGDDGGGGGSGGGGSGGGGSGGGDDDDDDDDGGGSGNSGSSRSGKGGSGTPSGKSSTSQRDGALARQLKGRIASISEVEAIASKAVPGEIIDVKLYRSKDRYLYRVKIIQRTGSIYDVRVDAVSRKVLSARER